MTLIPFSRSHDGSDCWKMAFLHPVSRLKRWILTKLVHLYCWDRDKKLIRFWWPWPHFQGHMMAQIVGKWLSCTLSPEWMDGFWLNLYIYIVVTWKKNWLYFGDLDPVFKVTRGLRLLKNVVFFAPFLMKEWMDFDQTCTTILLKQGQELIRFWWPWPHFQGHTRA